MIVIAASTRANPGPVRLAGTLLLPAIILWPSNEPA